VLAANLNRSSRQIRLGCCCLNVYCRTVQDNVKWLSKSVRENITVFVRQFGMEQSTVGKEDIAEKRNDFDCRQKDEHPVSPVYSRSSSSRSLINPDPCFSKLADTFLTPQETERCRTYLMDASVIRLTGLIAGSICCEVYAGFLNSTPIAVKRLRPQILRSQSTTVLKTFMNEVSFMSRSFAPSSGFLFRCLV
jgi:hypothetical protein